jgi:site-specific recombinase XerD
MPLSDWMRTPTIAHHPQPCPRFVMGFHMLRHSTGFKLANDGQDTRAIQHYLGHRNIQYTTIYTQFAPNRFNDFWKD